MLFNKQLQLLIMVYTTKVSYYVYIYLREDGSPYYVGKGRDERWKSKHHGVEVPPADRVIFPVTQTTEEWAHFMEMELIDLYGRLNDGTGILENWTDGGEGLNGYKHSKVTRRKISEVQKGKILSEEHKRKLSEAGKGVPKPPRTEEHKRKIGESKKGNQYCKGQTRSEESRRKMSESRKGKTHSEETKRKISEASKSRFWINDGIEERLIPSTDSVPDGYIRGRSARSMNT